MEELYCVICGRNHKTRTSKTYGEPLCSHHEYQYVKYGEFFKWNIHNENEYIIDGNITKILIRDKNMNIIATVIIDTINLEKVIEYKWTMNKGYAINIYNKLSMHELIFGKKDGFIIDHENRNRMDCREENLRHVTYQLNAINKGKQSNNTSGHVGVTWDINRNKWSACLKLDGKMKHLGRFDNIDDAVKARLSGEIKYFGFNVDRTNDCNTVFENKKKK